jgi:signal recognition particle GTPase
MRKLGPFSQILKRLPKPVREMAEGLDEAQVNAELDNVELIAAVMRPEELEDPAYLPDLDRSKQLAARAEVPVQEVLDLFEQLEAARRFLSGEEPPPFSTEF